MREIRLNNVPVLDGLETVLLGGDNGVEDDCLIAQRPMGSDEDLQPIAVFEAATGNAYPSSGGVDVAHVDGGAMREAGVAPLVRIVGDLAGETGQVTILQPDGSYRRYSRWDRISLTVPAQPDAIVRTLPQCGCGGYLGAPMMFDSFAEMTAYFLAVFADSE